LSLDWSRSYDETDFSPDTGTDSGSSGLSFAWSCFRESQSYLENCEGLLVFSLGSPSRLSISVNSSSFVLGSISVGDMLKVSLTGRSVSSEDDRACERTFNIAIVDDLSPVVSVSVLGGLLSSSSASSSAVVSSKLKIRATLDMKSAGLSTWSVNDESIVLSSQSLSPLSRQLPASPFGSPNVMSLVLIGNSLPPQATFIFTLTCTLDSGYSSSSHVTVTTNSPPFGGVLVVSPRKGSMLETMFSLFSSGWVGEDLPLSMQFGYLTSSTGVSIEAASVIHLHPPSISPLWNQLESDLCCGCI
jgi:hypothetical protein